MTQGHVDVLIIGAGLSGIGTACHLARECPEKSVAILERRNALGGTWDLFRFPGIRSDSDMCTMGYDFRPWTKPALLADGREIRQYIADTARQFGVEAKIRYGLRVVDARWTSELRHWTIHAVHESSGELCRFSCSNLIACTGYYSYDSGYLPTFRGEDDFKGIRIHPQQWPEDVDFERKRVVVIGSGATAVTLVPAVARSAEHVTMLQRSPSYILSLPANDEVSEMLARFLPRDWAYKLARARNIVFARGLYKACRRWPRLMRRMLLAHVRKQVGPDIDMRHFSPRYLPWDERLCFVPSGDLFKALREGRASVETDGIETFNETGIRLKSGKQLEADIIVTATGLNVQTLGGMKLIVDGEARSVSELMLYKGVLVEDVPNFAWIVGYTNATWTLKADIAARYLCRLFRYMDSKGLNEVRPRDREGCAVDDTIFNSLQSGYVQRSRDLMPRQGRRVPWKVLMDYTRDKRMLLLDPIEDDVLEFGGPAPSANLRMQPA